MLRHFFKKPNNPGALHVLSFVLKPCRRKGGHIYAPVAPAPQHYQQQHQEQQQQHYYPSQAADNQLEDESASQAMNEAVPGAFFEGEQGGSLPRVGGLEGSRQAWGGQEAAGGGEGQEEREHRHEQQPETSDGGGETDEAVQD